MHKGKRFSDRRVDLDGQTLIDCTFERCKLVFSGGELPTFHGTTFDSCQWIFGGAALRTGLFLALLRDLGGGEIVNGFIEQLSRVPRSATSARR
jgi:hypothetical protein